MEGVCVEQGACTGEGELRSTNEGDVGRCGEIWGDIGRLRTCFEEGACPVPFLWGAVLRVEGERAVVERMPHLRVGTLGGGAHEVEV